MDTEFAVFTVAVEFTTEFVVLPEVAVVVLPRSCVVFPVCAESEDAPDSELLDTPAASAVTPPRFCTNSATGFCWLRRVPAPIKAAKRLAA